MAATAVGTKLSIMQITGFVAAAAASASEFHSAERRAMAVIAADIDVRTREREVCLQVMIECPRGPGNRVVARAALLVEIAAVRIFFLMAGNASGFRLAESLCFMTVGALHIVVFSEQRKWAEIVIEKQRILPIHLGMAILALSAERLFVYIVIQMTGFASRCELDCKDRIDMAVVAGRFQMTAEQLVFRVRVVVKERFCPVVAGMARLAFFAIVSVVIIIFEMAGNTGCFHFVVKWTFGMTVAASELPVFAHEIEVCIP